MSVNKVILVGHVGKDPDVRHLDSGVAVARFSLATNETYTDKSGKKVTQTEWHNIVVWRGLADTVEKYVKAGKLLYIEGKLQTRSYQDKDGVKRYATEVVCDTFRFLGPAQTQGGDSGYAENQQLKQTELAAEVDAPMPNPDDLPF